MKATHAHNQRFFIAIPLPISTNMALTTHCQQIEQWHPHSTIRFTPEEKRHLTLAFLGDLEQHQINDACTVIRTLSHSAITLQLTTISRFPDHKSKIITAIPAASEGLHSLQEKLQLSLEDKGFPPRARPFRPHISLTRIKDTNDLLPIQISPPVDFPVTKIVLYRSQLTGKDSHYSMVEQQNLAIETSP